MEWLFDLGVGGSGLWSFWLAREEEQEDGKGEGELENCRYVEIIDRCYGIYIDF